MVRGGEKVTLLHCWWECKLVQPLWKPVWKCLKKLKTELLCDPEIPPGLTLKGNENTTLKRYTHPNIHSSTIYNSQDTEAYIYDWMNAKEEGSRGRDGWMASRIQWTWIWVNSGRWWRTEEPCESWTWFSSWTTTIYKYIHTRNGILAIKRMKFCHLQQYWWTLRVWCLLK